MRVNDAGLGSGGILLPFDQGGDVHGADITNGKVYIRTQTEQELYGTLP
ncbi:MAG TPA: hypothetical protein VMV61_03945 [Patescibacteria group bacterium]|nr:hypothetical protein [Patescibacteria group bacterium]